MGKTRFGTVRHYGAKVQFSCADVSITFSNEHVFQSGDKGNECPACLRWPLCSECLKLHLSGDHGEMEVDRGVLVKRDCSGWKFPPRK